MPDRMKIIRDIDDNGVLVVQGLSCDTVTPVGAYMAFVGDAQGFLLESVPVAYSFVGRFDQGGMAVIEEGQADPWSGVPVISRPLKFNDNGLPPFIGGHVGYIGYDMVRGVEVLPRPQRASGFPDAMLGKASTVLVFDHLKQELKMLRAIPEPGISDREASTRARRDFQEIEDALSSGLTDIRPQMPRFKGVREVSLSDADFTGAVLAAKDYLRRGDIMQVVLSRRLRIDIEGHPFDIYRRLRRINPSPYLFHIKLGDVTLIGSSPEEMVRLQGDAITTVPIAGTRPRGRNDREDEELVQDLLGDDKERAEHLMLLDLARNDLGRVSIPGSINVVQREKVRFYSHVMHIVSCVEGKRRPGINAVDVLKACFPAGTVSGAPKVRALEIIDELEGRCRGPYAGAVGYLSFNGTMDTGILIRTIFARAGRTYLQAGAGIVWDSTPEREMREIDSKLRALQTALGGIA